MTTEKEQLEAEIAERDARIEQLSLCNDGLARKLACAATELAALKAQQPSAGVVDERVEFELGINPHCRRMNEHGDYVVPEIQDRWDGWQARARLNPCRAQAVPSVCDGKEQDSFEVWAADAKYDMSCHPLHWLFLNEKTYSARQGWKGALEYVARSFGAAPSANSEQARSCVTCNGVGIIGHSTLCPECAAAPSTKKESGDE